MTPYSRKLLQTGGAFIAISMLSACSTTSGPAGGFMETLGDVGAKTMELGGRALAGTADFLHLHDEAEAHGGASRSDVAQAGIDSDILQTEALDGELDMALMETETTLLDGDVIVEAAESNIIVREPLDETLQGTLEGTNLVDNTELGLESESTLTMATPDPLAIDPLANPDPLAPIELAATTATPVPASASSAQSVATSDLIHEVQAKENLWDIAKSTTGDANNWHVLADINNLAPNASVFPGQELTIPADMIKPGYLKGTSLNTAAATAAQDTVVTAASTETKRLVIPAEGVQADADAPMVDITADAQQFKVGPGESLWNFAKRTTGDATNWKTIAAQNNFTEKQATSVYPGQSVYVPSSLVKSIDGGDNAVVAAAPAKQVVKTEIAAAPKANDTDTDALEAAAAVLASSASILDDKAPIKIVEAKFQESEVAIATPEVETAQIAVEAKQQITDNAAQQIMVSGTYYPKAIYNEADFSSSLLMRVSPGTQLSVSKAVGPWYQVMTEKGVGYVHARDIR